MPFDAAVCNVRRASTVSQPPVGAMANALLFV